MRVQLAPTEEALFRDRHQSGGSGCVVLRDRRRDVLAQMFRRNAEQEEQVNTHRRAAGKRFSNTIISAIFFTY